MLIKNREGKKTRKGRNALIKEENEENMLVKNKKMKTRRRNTMIKEENVDVLVKAKKINKEI